MPARVSVVCGVGSSPCYGLSDCSCTPPLNFETLGRSPRGTIRGGCSVVAMQGHSG